MVKKVIFSVVLLLALLSTVSPMPVFAASDVGYVEFKGQVPKGFNNNLVINLIAEDGSNALFTITKDSNYTAKKAIQAGKYTVDYIKIVDNVKPQYDSSVQETIVIRKNTSTQLPFEIIDTLAPTQDGNQTNSTTPDTAATQQPTPEQQQATTTTTVTAATVAAPTTPGTAASNSKSAKPVAAQKSSIASIFSSMFTVFIVIVLGIILAGIRFRRWLDKDDD